MCTVTRVDAKAFNTGWTQNLGTLVEDTTNAYIFWCGIDPAINANTIHNAEIRVRPLNKATLALGSVVQIATDVVNDGRHPDMDGVGVIRLDSGTFIVGWGVYDPRASESTDAVTWSAAAAIDNSGGNRCFGGIGTDGTNVWAISQDSNTYDLYLWKRTGIGTWDAGRRIHDAGGASSSPWYDVFPSYRLGPMQCIAMNSSTVGCVVLSYAPASNNQTIVGCLWTTDGWTTTNQSTIKDYAGSPNNILPGAMPKIKLGADGRLRAMWIEQNAAAGFGVPMLAYSNNMGQTWTVIGTPTVLTAHAWDNTYDGAFCLDSEDRMYLSVFDASDASNIQHFLYKGGDAITGWEEIATCAHLEAAVTIINLSSGMGGAGFIDSQGSFVRVFNGVKDDATDYNIVAFLAEEGADEGGGGPPPLVEEAASGIDQPNVYLRLRLAERRGWSVHDLALSWMIHWPEGDWTTQRQLDLLIGAVGSIDPSVDDPSHLPALYVMDNPEHYAREVVGSDADGNAVARLDPFRFECETAPVPIAGPFGTGLLRGFFIEYRSVSEVRIEILIDDQVVQEETLPISAASITAGAAGEMFYPIYTDENNGRYASVRIVDESEHPFILEAISAKRIDKGDRG